MDNKEQDKGEKIGRFIGKYVVPVIALAAGLLVVRLMILLFDAVGGG